MSAKDDESNDNFFMNGLALLFIGLKLGGVIKWSWWWVLSPFWLPVAVLLIGAAAIYATAYTIKFVKFCIRKMAV